MSFFGSWFTSENLLKVSFLSLEIGVNKNSYIPSLDVTLSSDIICWIVLQNTYLSTNYEIVFKLDKMIRL